MKPASSMNGSTQSVNIAPPVIATSTKFIANSIDTIEISDMPMAVLKARFNAICRDKMTVSSAIDVSKPLTIAKLIIAQTGQAMPVS